MRRGGVGGANTKTGLVYENEVDFLVLIAGLSGYGVDGDRILYRGEEVGRSFKKHGLYRYLREKGIDYKVILSRKLLPDDAIFVIANNTMFILEIKFQSVAGSTDEKLQTCAFKIRQYRRVLAELNVEVEYIYILNDWFKASVYRDVLDYILSVPGCSYYFQYLPLQKIGLPVPDDEENSLAA